MEQSYKEKYEQAIERLKQWDREHPCAGYVLSDRDKFIFPELADNKDERIRKALKQYFVNSFKNNGVAAICGVHVKDVIAWLENIPYTIDHEKREGFHLGYRACLEKRGEQKPADSYCQENCKGFQETGKCFADGECKAKREAEQKPASEEDEPQKELAKSYLAKFDEKFPILPTLKGKQLADYKNFLNKCQQIFGLKYWGIRPLQAKLFEKLSLLWAAWGAEHLQGLGQTDGDMDNEISMWSEEDEDYLFLLNSICKDAEEKYRNSPDVLVRKEIANARNWLKSLKDRVGCEANCTTTKEWSEEDDNDAWMNDIISKVENNLQLNKAEIDWLKFIKDQVQPKQEWTEENKDYYDAIISKLEVTQEDAALTDNQMNFLKSLRPQSRWKPSSEQIGLLQAIINEPNNAASESCQIVLREVLEQLKKLKEE